MVVDEKLLAEKLFGYSGLFEENWNDGWRPTIDGDDILFMSDLGSYVRCSKSEHGDDLAFIMLADYCKTHKQYAQYVSRRGRHYRWDGEQAPS